MYEVVLVYFFVNLFLLFFIYSTPAYRSPPDKEGCPQDGVVVLIFPQPAAFLKLLFISSNTQVVLSNTNLFSNLTTLILKLFM